MARISKVTDPAKMVTDSEMLRELVRQGIDKDYVEFHEDYTTEHPSVKFYRDLKSGKRFMVVSGLPKVTNDGTKVEAKWLLSGGKYLSKANLFSAAVESGKVEVSVEEKRATWNLQVFLNGVEQSCGDCILLGTDPDNENYYNNVLEWDYGVCKRRLRVIEGGIFDRKIVESNPHGEIRVKLNQSGNMPLRLSAAVDAQDNRLGRVEGDEEIVSAEEFDGAIYPVTIGASLTVYTTSSDGHIYVINANYATAHDAASGTVDDTSNAEGVFNRKLGSDYTVSRFFTFFDTSALGADAVITDVVDSLYGQGSAEGDAAHPDYGIVEGIQAEPLEADDFGDHLSKTTLGQDAYFDVSANFVTSGYNDMTRNATGRGWVNKTGTTLTCYRCKGDIDNSTPTADNYVQWWTSEKGTGYQPKLVVTYTAVTLKTSSDSGGGSESSSQGATLSKGDSGSGSEFLGSRTLALTETGSGIGVSSLLAVLIGLEETGLGSEFATKAFSVFDSGTGVDGVITRLLAVTESGSALEAALLVAVLISDDGGLGSDLSTLLGAILAGDEGSGFGALRALVEIPATGSDMRLPASLGQAGIPSKGVNL